MQDIHVKNLMPATVYRFKNLGPVKDASLELGDLTIIAGHNNTGKTYIAYALYGFLKMWESWPVGRLVSSRLKPATGQFPSFSEINKTLIDEGVVRIPLDQKNLARQRQLISRHVARAYSARTISGIFSATSDNFKHASIAVKLGERGSWEDVKIKGVGGMNLSTEGSDLVIEMADLKSLGKRGIGSTLSSLSHNYGHFLFANEIPEPFILSAERFGISLFYKELDFTKNRIVDFLQKLGDADKGRKISPYLLLDEMASRYALPIKDNIGFTRSISDLRKERSKFYDDKLFDNVKDMMDGYYRATHDDIHFVSKARKAGKFQIPLHLASSSARGLSDLYFFLKHHAKPNSLVIIDEPESHLDTTNQILLARLLANMVRAGLKILVTTHSDYLIKEINNLVMLHSSFPEKDKVLKRFRYDADESIAPESIRAYVAEQNQLKPCDVDRFGINMPVFDETIDSINIRANDLASRLSDSSGHA